MLHKRKGDDNIGKLIMFALTILIAVGLLTLIGYFFSENMEKTKVVSVLANSTQTVDELTKVGILTTVTGADTVTSSYDVLSELHTITIVEEAAGQLDTLNADIITKNTKYSNIDTTDATKYVITYSL